MTQITNVVVIFCAPQSQYPEQPTDQSKSRLIDCPECKKPMWFSVKKEEYKKIAESKKKEIIFCCYICFEKKALANPEYLQDCIQINI